MLFHQSFTKNAKNLREYEILKLKLRSIGNLTQKNFEIFSKKQIEKVEEQKK